MAGPAAPTRNLIVDYYDQWPDVVSGCGVDPVPCTDPTTFSPGFELPKMDHQLARYYSVATARWHRIGEYRGSRLALLDLTGNPGTHTTKTMASLLIVARAVRYIQDTSEPIMLFTPTSANKGTALRDAVLRAIETNLVTPEQLRVTTLAPKSSLGKLRTSRLATDATLRMLNPLLIYDGPQAENVKSLGREFVAAWATTFTRRTGGRIWFSLDLDNYIVADMARALFEHDVAPIVDRPRLHAHAVSSAFGLLGYHRGRALLEERGQADPALRPASLLVQHLHTPDMVLSLVFGDASRSNVPTYRQAGAGEYRQDADPHFPFLTHDPAENLDPTFYSHQPTTSEPMNEIISRFGGTGIVVSRHECLDRYHYLKERLTDTSRPLPDDPDTLREWSLVMALTGVLNALDRGLVDSGRDVVVHGSGSYAVADYAPIELHHVTKVDTVADIAAATGVA